MLLIPARQGVQPDAMRPTSDAARSSGDYLVGHVALVDRKLFSDRSDLASGMMSARSATLARQGDDYQLHAGGDEQTNKRPLGGLQAARRGDDR
jgi:hypothetical protein